MDLSKHADFIGEHGFECLAWEDESAIIVFGTSWNNETKETFDSVLHYSEDGITETIVGNDGASFGGTYESTRAFLGY